MSDNKQNIHFSKVIISNPDIAIVLNLSKYLIKLNILKTKLVLIHFSLKNVKNDNIQDLTILNKFVNKHRHMSEML